MCRTLVPWEFLPLVVQSLCGLWPAQGCAPPTREEVTHVERGSREQSVKHSEQGEGQLRRWWCSLFPSSFARARLVILIPPPSSSSTPSPLVVVPRP